MNCEYNIFCNNLKIPWKCGEVRQGDSNSVNTLCLMTPNPQVHKDGRMCLSEMAQKKTPIISFWFLKKHYCLCGQTCQNCKLNHKMDGDYLNNGRLPASRDILQIVLHLFANSGGPPVGVKEDGAPHHPTHNFQF